MSDVQGQHRIEACPGNVIELYTDGFNSKLTEACSAPSVDVGKSVEQGYG